MSERDDFWGDVPDWTDDAPRPSRGRHRRADGTVPTGRPGLSGRLKGLLGSAMSAGADATREHRIVDATHADPTGELDPFADFDPYDLGDLGPTTDRRPAADRGIAAEDRPVGTEIPVVDARRAEPPRRDPDRPTHYDVDDAHAWNTDAWHDDSWDDLDDRVPGVASLDAAFAPTIDDGRSDRAPRGGIDPLLARMGAVAVVATMLVPLAVAMTSDDGPSDLLAAATTATSEPVVETAAESTTAVATDAPSSSVDISDLPLAVPVNTEAGSTDQGAATLEVARADSTASDGADDTATTTAPGELASDASTTSAQPTTVATSRSEATSRATADTDSIAATADADDVADRTEATCSVDYTLVEGDFWIRLADAADVDLADLLDANDATVDTPLYPGRQICLPAGAQTPAPPTTTATTVEATTTTSTTTTTAATTSTTTTTTVAPPPAGPADVEQIIRDIWPDELEDRALEIAYRESRYVPTAKNYCCYGLFQIYWSVHQGWLAGIGITDDQQLYDPATNARAALALYERAGGWGPWGF